MIQTVDFFTTIGDDPDTFGQIAAPNSLSDEIMQAFEQKNMDTKVSIIGKVVEKGEKLIRLY